MKYDAAAVRNMNVDPQKWRWFSMNFDRYKLPDPVPGITMQDEKKIAPARRKLFVGAMITYAVALLILPVLMPKQTMFAGLLPGLILLGIGQACFSLKTWARVLGHVIYGVLTAASIMLVVTGAVSAVSLGFLLAPYFIMLLESKSTTTTSYLVTDESKLSGLELWNAPHRRVWGKAGGVASAADKFGEEAVAAGVEGEERTLLLLDMLLAVPGTTVYHGLKFPGSKDADVDHAVAHGSNVYLIDSKMYRWGAYEWKEAAGGDLIARSDGYGRPRKNHMAAAAQGYRELLGRHVNVIPIVLMHGKNVSVAGNQWSRSGVGMFTAQDALEFIGNSIGDNIRLWRDDESVRRVLLGNMKPW